MFQKGNQFAKKENPKESYLMVRVAKSYKARVVKAAGGKKLSQYIIGLIDKDLKERGVNNNGI